MKRLLLTVVMAIGIVATWAQYDIIPMPQRISLDAKGAVLNIEGRPQVTERLNKDIAVPSLASLCYALTFVAIVGLVGWLLYWRKIFIKI